ncbi:MAG: hypothetical protein Kow0092_17900 [Deferrisomatales bacterium]
MKYRVFVFEDNEEFRSVVEHLLSSLGFEVLGFPEPSLCPIYLGEGQRCPHEHACGDFLLTDNQMPRVTGLKLVEHQSRGGCKGMVRNKAILSAAFTPEEVERAQRLGCKVFEKPPDFDELLRWIEEGKAHIDPGRRLEDLPEELLRPLPSPPG